MLGRTELAFLAVQIVHQGGETNLHSHSNVDGFWTVLSGRARFYTSGDEIVAELGANEGVVIPRNFPYWFESVGTEDLEILQFEAAGQQITDSELEAGRIDYAPKPTNFDDVDYGR